MRKNKTKMTTCIRFTCFSFSFKKRKTNKQKTKDVFVEHQQDYPGERGQGQRCLKVLDTRNMLMKYEHSSFYRSTVTVKINVDIQI